MYQMTYIQLILNYLKQIKYLPPWIFSIPFLAPSYSIVLRRVQVCIHKLLQLNYMWWQKRSWQFFHHPFFPNLFMDKPLPNPVVSILYAFLDLLKSGLILRTPFPSIRIVQSTYSSEAVGSLRETKITKIRHGW